MLQKFKQHIDHNFSFLYDKKLLLAVSGGVDSVLLSHLLYQLNFDMALAHCNFQLRGTESDLDEQFVINLAQKLDRKVFTKRFHTTVFAEEEKQSIQMAARNLRYSWFQELITTHSLDYVLTAHHADDNLETFLINITRRTGLEGLTGIPSVHGNIVRPLLAFSRDELLEFARENKIQWREDESNSSTKYIRNKIRHQVVPVLKEINPGLLSSFAKTTENLQKSRQIAQDRIEDIQAKVMETEGDLIKIDCKEVQKLSDPKAYLYQFLNAYGFTEWDDVSDLLSAQSGKQVFSKTHRLLKDREFLLLTKKVSASTPITSFRIEEHVTEITKPIRLSFEETTKKITESNKEILVDKSLLKFPLLVRKWDYGDYFYPIKMSGSKKISRYFNDRKFSLLDKESTWLLSNADHEIIWVINHRQDRRFVNTEATKSILKITAL